MEEVVCLQEALTPIGRFSRKECQRLLAQFAYLHSRDRIPCIVECTRQQHRTKRHLPWTGLLFPKTPFRLLLDGNNVLSVPVVKCSLVLVNKLLSHLLMLRKSNRLIDELVLVLDGPGSDYLFGTRGVQVVFSQNREADDVLAHWKWIPQTFYIIVTSDRGLAARIRSQGPFRVMKSHLFRTFLSFPRVSRLDS
jgi:hypothetical protein